MAYNHLVLGAAVTFTRWSSASVRDRLEALGDELAGTRHRAGWSTVGADSVLVVTSTADRGDSMAVRLSEDGALLDVNGGNAIEFAYDDGDVEELLAVATAFYRGDLELVVGADDRTWLGVRVGALELVAPGLPLLRRRRVRPMR